MGKTITFWQKSRNQFIVIHRHNKNKNGRNNMSRRWRKEQRPEHKMIYVLWWVFFSLKSKSTSDVTQKQREATQRNAGVYSRTRGMEQRLGLKTSSERESWKRTQIDTRRASTPNLMNMYATVASQRYTQPRGENENQLATGIHYPAVPE